MNKLIKEEAKRIESILDNDIRLNNPLIDEIDDKLHVNVTYLTALRNIYSHMKIRYMISDFKECTKLINKMYSLYHRMEVKGFILLYDMITLYILIETIYKFLKNCPYGNNCTDQYYQMLEKLHKYESNNLIMPVLVKI